MSAHYLVDIFSTPISTAPINDVRYPTDGQSVVNGNFVVLVPDNVSVQLPTDLSDLITKKYAGLLASYAGFTTIVRDDLLDSTGIDFGSPNTTKGFFGERGSISLSVGGSLQSVVEPLGSTPTQVVVTWELYYYVESNPIDGPIVHTFSELSTDSSNATVQVSFNGGVTFTSVTDGFVLNIALADQGSDFVFQITNATPDSRIWVGSWSVIF